MTDKRLNESAIKTHFKSRKDQTPNPGARYLLASTDWVQVTQDTPPVRSVRLPDEEFSPKLVLPAARLLNLRRARSSIKSTHGIVHFPNSLKIIPNLFTDVTFSNTTKNVRHHLVPQMYSTKQNCLQLKKHFLCMKSIEQLLQLLWWKIWWTSPEIYLGESVWGNFWHLFLCRLQMKFWGLMNCWWLKSTQKLYVFCVLWFWLNRSTSTQHLCTPARAPRRSRFMLWVVAPQTGFSPAAPRSRTAGRDNFTFAWKPFPR